MSAGSTGTTTIGGWRQAMSAALLSTLARPWTWLVALSGFLVRGGIAWFLAPIVVLPTTASLANELSPRLRALVLSTPSFELLVEVGLVVGAIVGAILLGGLAGAWVDAVLIAEAASDEDLANERPRLPSQRGVSRRVLGARLLAHLPLAATLAAVAPIVIATVYGELTNPDEVVTPLVVRTIERIPGVAVAVVAAWLVGEVAGGIAARHVVLGGARWVAAVGVAYRDLLRHPIDALATTTVTSLAVLAAVVPAALAAGLAWSFARLAIQGDRGPLEASISVALFLVVWIGGLVMAGATTALRSHAWTATWIGHHPVPAPAGVPGVGEVGTIGGMDTNPRGGWPSA